MTGTIVGTDINAVRNQAIVPSRIVRSIQAHGRGVGVMEGVYGVAIIDPAVECFAPKLDPCDIHQVDLLRSTSSTDRALATPLARTERRLRCSLTENPSLGEAR